MNKHSIYLFLVLMLISSISLAQTDFRSGYYITWENDTVKGLVDYRGEIRNSRFCVFKANENASEIKLMPSEIMAYRFLESKFYISKAVAIEDSTEQVFLEFLLNGVTNLYYHKNLNSFKYFIENQSGELLELENELETIHLDGKGTFVRSNNKHIGLLKVTFSDCIEIQNDINDIELNHASLIHITKEYHDYVCDDEKCIVYEKKPETVKLKWSIYSGFNLSNLSIDEGFGSLNDQFSSSVFPTIGVAFDLTLPRVNEKISLYLSTDIGKNSFSSIYMESQLSISRKYSVTIEHFPVYFNSGLKYTFPKGKFRPVFLAGGGLMHMLNQNNTLQKDLIFDENIETTYSDLSVKKTTAGFLFNAGVNYVKNNQHKAYLELNYRKFIGSTGNYYRNLSMKSIMINLGYYLN